MLFVLKQKFYKKEKNIMVQTIKISREEMNFINNLLNLSGDEIYQKYGYKRDETIIHTPSFQMELKQILSW